MEWMALSLSASHCATLALSKLKLKGSAFILKVTIIGIDLAKKVCQLHGAAEDGFVVFRKKLSRPLFERFMAGYTSSTTKPAWTNDDAASDLAMVIPP